MGELQTVVGLPKKILLQGWAGDQDDNDINGEYIYGKFTIVGQQERSGYIRQGAYLAYIYSDGYQWNHYSDDAGWINNSSNPNVLPLNGWTEYNAQGPAGSITILENISEKNAKTSIKKQNTGGGKISLYKKFVPNALQGLALWLKADAGVAITPETYVSQIVISGLGTTTSNGTYTRTSGGNTTFNGPNGNTISPGGSTEWVIYDTQLYNPLDESNGAHSYFTDTFETSTPFESWYISGQNLGASPAPSGVVTNSPTVTLFVTGWADQSGNGNNATARAGGATLVSSVINEKPILRFDGTANLITNNFFVHNYNTPITIIAVSKASASTVRGEQPTARYIAGVTNNGGYEFGLSYGAYSAEDPSFSNSYGIFNVGGADIESSPMGENEKRIASTINNGSEISFFLDGSLVGTADPVDQSGGNNSTGAFSIGSEVVLGWGDDFFCTCDIAEIIIYNRAITTTERQQVETYLNDKYNIY